MSRVPARPDMGECRGEDTDQYTGIMTTGGTRVASHHGSGHGRPCMNIPRTRSGSHSLMPGH
eukprot:3535729-Prymnesium_polylepis.1